MGSQPWMTFAACAGETSIMFPTPNDVPGEAAAKAVCAICPARVACLEYALATRQQDGVWGGYSETERRRILRRRRSHPVSEDQLSLL